MKSFLKKILENPKITITLFAVLAIVIVSVLYPAIGLPPKVDVSKIQSSSRSFLLGMTVNLSFPKSGRLESVAVKVGDKVRAGDILARLSAPDVEGAVAQAKGALDLAKAQYASLNSQYETAKAQQDLLVRNAYRTLLSSSLEAVPQRQTKNVGVVSGTYTCDKEGSYILDPYRSADNDSGYSFNYSGLETGTASVKYDSPIPLATCGLQIKFIHNESFDDITNWTIDIPNTKSASYLANKNAYDLAMTNRDKVLSDLAQTIGSSTHDTSVSSAQIRVAEGTYEAALGAYQNNLIVAPYDGVISFVDSDLKNGQSVMANKPVINITTE